ncbi:VOC family protein [Endozoicomonas arenosclerae]|uniref:VOC family protein n=1 Tax=Endozoicomonas arenosclerae TaxID=1633495 RepID=UPI000A5EF5DB|nr:VOC family protein [Endozoicomonas arenosclerae]
MIIDHIGFSVSHYEESKDFYCKVLAPLGIELVMEVNGWAGLGAHQKPELWFGEGDKPQNPMHLAFNAPDRAAVDKFYELAIAAGAVDNGAPGVREIYHPDYYGAFVIDPNGHNLEAVCHSQES